MGLQGRRFRNEGLRANGVEPVPGRGDAAFCGVKRIMRYLKRVRAREYKVKGDPLKYLHSAERKRRMEGNVST